MTTNRAGQPGHWPGLSSGASACETPFAMPLLPWKEDPVIETTVCPGSSIVCKPLRNLDWACAMSLRHVVRDSLQTGVEIVIDLSQVNCIDSVGMHALVGTVRLARALGGSARITNARPQVDKFMELVGVYRLLMRSPVPNTSGAA
jgi:anti-anti-sigma factor